jgi:hypothetical protein
MWEEEDGAANVFAAGESALKRTLPVQVRSFIDVESSRDAARAL